MKIDPKKAQLVLQNQHQMYGTCVYTAETGPEIEVEGDYSELVLALANVAWDVSEFWFAADAELVSAAEASEGGFQAYYRVPAHTEITPEVCEQADALNRERLEIERKRRDEKQRALRDNQLRALLDSWKDDPQVEHDEEAWAKIEAQIFALLGTK